MKQILFDLDGTLTDSGEGIMHCAELTLAHYHLPIPDRAQMRSMVGPPLRDSFLRFGIRQEDLADAVEFYRKHYLAVGQFENAPYQGIQEVLERLQEDGCALYVATSKPETMAKGILEHFDLAKYFRIVCGAVPGGRSTKEAVVGHLLTLLDDGHTRIMVGDTIYDVEGAAYHGISTVAVNWGYGDVQQMQAAGAMIANTMEELYQLLTK